MKRLKGEGARLAFVDCWCVVRWMVWSWLYARDVGLRLVAMGGGAGGAGESIPFGDTARMVSCNG